MTELATDWVGFRLSTPFVVGASPLTDDVGALRCCVECGAGAVVMRSLFEEQIVAEQLAAHRFIDSHVDAEDQLRCVRAGAKFRKSVGGLPVANGPKTTPRRCVPQLGR